MGFLQLSLPAFSKAVISVWFRIPSDVLAAVSALSESGDVYDGYEGSAGCSPPLSKIIPLIVFGSREVTLPGASTGGGLPLSPSFIGVDCGNGSYGTSPGPRLAVNLQTSINFSFSKAPAHPEFNLRPACYYMNGYFPGSAHVPSQFLTVTPEVWHHALISFDISPSCSITYGNLYTHPFDPDPFEYSLGPTFSWAFDDVAKVGASMLPGGSGGNRWGLDLDATDSLNKHILPNGFFSTWSGQDIASSPIENSTDFGVSLSGGSIASGTLGIPSASDFIANAYQIEMAYPQIYTGVTLDATLEESRRAFVKSSGTPETNYSIADGLLGTSPKIRLKKSKDWQTVKNSGSASGLARTGTINPYSPGPNITP